MNLLITTESYYPNISGVAVFSHRLAKKMVELGHRVTVIAPSPKFSEYVEKIDGIKIYRLKSKINPFRQGYYVTRFPYFEIKKIINDLKPDIIHAQDPVAVSLSALLIGRHRRIPIIATNHFSLEYVVSYLPFFKLIHPFILFLLSTYLGFFYNRCKVLTFPTQTIANSFKAKHLKAKAKVISNGVDLSRFMPYYGGRDAVKEKYHIPLNDSVILSVGRLDQDKKIDILIKAFTQSALSQCHLVICGAGIQKENLIRLSRDLGVEKRVSFVGSIAHESSDLPKIYQMATVFVNPCPIETQGVAVLEAEATGLPIVAANSGALPELVKDGRNGFLFAPNNIEALSNKLIKILSNTKMLDRMGKSSLEIVESQIVDNTYREFEKLYKEIIKNEIS